MKRKILIIIFLVSLAGCKPKLNYKLTVTLEETDASGAKTTMDIDDVIVQTSDSLAYFDASATFLMYRNSFDLNGYEMAMGRPLSFKVFDARGKDLRTTLNSTAVSFIDEYYEEHYQRAKPGIEKRRKRMLETMNAR